jgi:hypothetical protein
VFRELSVAKQRYQAVLEVIEEGVQVTEAAVKARVTRHALHSRLSRYAERRLEALADRSHRPRSCPHQMDPAVDVRLVELRGRHPGERDGRGVGGGGADDGHHRDRHHARCPDEPSRPVPACPHADGFARPAAEPKERAGVRRHSEDPGMPRAAGGPC